MQYCSVLTINIKAAYPCLNGWDTEHFPFSSQRLRHGVFLLRISTVEIRSIFYSYLNRRVFFILISTVKIRSIFYSCLIDRGAERFCFQSQPTISDFFTKLENFRREPKISGSCNPLISLCVYSEVERHGGRVVWCLLMKVASQVRIWWGPISFLTIVQRNTRLD